MFSQIGKVTMFSSFSGECCGEQIGVYCWRKGFSA